MTKKPLARMVTGTSIERLGRPVSPLVLEMLSAANLPWHEDTAALRAGLRRRREVQRLLAWVRSQMLFRLTPTERQSIELYYFEDKTYREAARELGVNPSSVHRAVRRGLQKLRIAARRRPPPRMRRRRTPRR